MGNINAKLKYEQWVPPSYRRVDSITPQVMVVVVVVIVVVVIVVIVVVVVVIVVVVVVVVVIVVVVPPSYRRVDSITPQVTLATGTQAVCVNWTT